MGPYMNKHSTKELIERTTRSGNIQIDTLRKVIGDKLQAIRPVMDDYDGGQAAAYAKVLRYLDRVSQNRVNIISGQR